MRSIKLCLAIVLSLLVASPAAWTRGYSGHTSRYCTTCARDARGRIKRSPEARAAFKRMNPCPSTGRTSGACPGYVIDHRQALKHGGSDTPANMQWQTVEAAKAKDKTE